MIPRRMLAVALLATASGVASAAERPSAADPELLRGQAQVKAGQHETAIETLQSVVRRLYGDPGQAPLVALAYVHMGAAHVARGEAEAASAVFDAALELDPKLRLGPGTLSPEATVLFEDIRRRRSQTAAPARSAARRRTAGKVALGALGAAGAATGAVVLARGNDEGPAVARFVNLRFATPLVVCPNGSANFPVPFTMLVDAIVREPIQIREAYGAAISAFPNVRTTVSALQPTVVSPRALEPDGAITLQIESSALCNNPEANAPFVTEWRGAVTFETSAGRFYAETLERIRVQFP